MSETGQVTSSAAEVYDEFFLPALFSAWPPQIVAAAHLEAGMRVLDVACGTGALTIEAAHAVSPGGTAVGLDVNSGMLAVAQKNAPEIDWREASAESLPFENGEFDAVVSQFGLMFFRDRRAALREMWRVLRQGGRLAIAVWDALENTPGYLAVTALCARLFGEEIADVMRSPYCLGDPVPLEAILVDSGIDDPSVVRAVGQARFPSIRSWMHTDVRGWTLSDKLDDRQYELLVSEALVELREFVRADDSVQFDHPAVIATAQKR